MKKIQWIILVTCGITGLVMLAACQLTTQTATKDLTPFTMSTNLPASTTRSPALILTDDKRISTKIPAGSEQTTTPVDTRPSVTPSPTLFPTYSPSTALPDARYYRLVDWSGINSSNLVSLAESNIPSEPEEYTSEKYKQYVDDFKSAAAALTTSYQEALLRAPTNENTDLWQIRLIYSQAVNGYIGADSLNHFLVRQISDGKIPAENINTWLTTNLNRPPGFPFDFEPFVSKVRLPASFSIGYLIRINNGGMGASCSILAKDREGYHSYTLIDSFDFEDASPVHQEIRCEIADFTGDGIDEVLIISEWGGRLVSQNFTLYSLDQWPPRRLELDPEVSLTNHDSWPSRYYFNEIVIDGNSTQLKLSLWPSSWDCWIFSDIYYRWNGIWLAQEGYGPADGDHYYDPTCAENLNLAQTPQQLRPVFLERFIKAQPNNDSLRYKLGVEQALSGNFEQSAKTLEMLLSTPTDLQNKWVNKAQNFLRTYNAENQIFKACIYTSDCSPNEAMSTLTRTMPAELLSDSPGLLRENGVPILSSGNLPGASTLWVTVHFPGRQNPEFWLIEAQESNLSATFVFEIKGSFTAPSKIDNGAPDGFTLYEAGETLFFYAISPNSGPSFIQKAFSENSEREEPHILYKRISDQLLSGGKPSLLLDQMKNIRREIALNDNELYLYGLAAELSNQSDEAVNAYWQVWHEFPDSPYASLARFKLVNK